MPSNEMSLFDLAAGEDADCASIKEQSNHHAWGKGIGHGLCGVGAENLKDTGWIANPRFGLMHNLGGIIPGAFITARLIVGK